MLKDFFESLKSYFTDQARVIPVEIGGISPSRRVISYWDPEAKEVINVNRDRPDNRHKLLSIDSVIAYVRNHAIEDESLPVNIWIGPRSVTVECVENDPKDVVAMPLVFCPFFQLLLNLGGTPSKTQTDAIKLLRQQFAPFDPGSKALTAVRNLKISTGDDFDSEQSHVASRIGKSVMQQASGSGDLPEYLDVTTQVYLKGGSSGYKVRVWLSVDFSKKGNIAFEPDAAALEEVQLLERAEIFGQLAAALSDKNVSIYEGEYSVG